MFGKLLPQEHRFFEMFSTSAAKIQEGVALCEELMEKYDNLEERTRQIKDVEHACDQLTHQTLAFLNSTFITPFDRSHIHALVTKMDDILDFVDAASQRLFLYRVKEPTEDLKQQVRILKRSVEVLARSVAALEHMKKSSAVLELCVELNTLENEGDVVMRQAMAHLFENHTDPIYIIKMKEIYETFEMAIDTCEDVANVIETVVLENA